MESKRCPWVDLSKEDYVRYHDEEWGVPVHDDRKHFEFLVLESAQAGLNWYTILKRRAHYRRLFADFDPEKVAQFSQARIEKMLLDPGIIRNRLKVEAAVNNAKRFLEVQVAFGSFDHYIWGFVDHEVQSHRLRTLSEYPATSPESDALSKDMKKRGFKFIGSTIIYAHMQATGLFNDHSLDCFCRE